MKMILALEEGLKDIPVQKLKKARENVRKMRDAEEKTAFLSESEIKEMINSGSFAGLPLMERQFIAAKLHQISYGEYRMLMDDLYYDPNKVELCFENYDDVRINEKTIGPVPPPKAKPEVLPVRERVKNSKINISPETTIDELYAEGLISARAYHTLKKNGKYTSVQDLCACTIEDLMRVRNMGKRALEELIELLNACGCKHKIELPR